MTISYLTLYMIFAVGNGVRVRKGANKTQERIPLFVILSISERGV
jgi:hypothetical protein